MAPVVVMLFAPRASTPAVVVMVTGLALLPTEPLSVSPVLSVRLKAPPRVTLPSVVMELVPVPLGTRAMELLVLAVSAPAVIPVFRFCVTAPVMSPAPSTTVPVALMVPRATVLAFWMVTAVALALVVLSVLAFSWMAAAPPLIVIVPAPAFTAAADACV